MPGRTAVGNQFQPAARDGPGASYTTVNPDIQSCGSGIGSLNFLERGASEYAPIGSTQVLKTAIPSSAIIDRFDPERRCRAFVIENVPTNLSYMSLAGFFNVRKSEFVPLF